MNPNCAEYQPTNATDDDELPDPRFPSTARRSPSVSSDAKPGRLNFFRDERRAGVGDRGAPFSSHDVSSSHGFHQTISNSVACSVVFLPSALMDLVGQSEVTSMTGARTIKRISANRVQHTMPHTIMRGMKILIDRWVHRPADPIESVVTQGLGHTFLRWVMGMVDRSVEKTTDIMVAYQRRTSQQKIGETDTGNEALMDQQSGCSTALRDRVAVC